MSLPMLLAALASLIWVGVVTGSYVVEVRVHSYRNLSGRCDECRVGTSEPGCCDELFIRPIAETCPESCDTTADYCIRSFGDQSRTCPSNQIVMGESFGTDSDSFIFGNFFFGLTNPIVEFDTQAWEGIQLFFMSVDCSGPEDANCATIQRIDSFPVDIRIPVGTARPETQYTGNAGIAQLNVSFEVRCAEDFYGEDCLTDCSGFQSCAGCGLSGFTGEFCQFGVGSCSEIYCNGDGDCLEGDSACVCDSGYTGDFCQDNIDDCDGISCNNNGTCIDEVNDFVCDCVSGFTGNLCQFNIDDCGDTSCNNGECVDGINDFTCDCEPGFTGDTCVIDIEDCEGVNCNNGECKDEVDGFTCTCDSGFSGDLCQEEITGAGSASVGGIAGGVVGALIGVILIAIIVMVMVLVLSRTRRNKGHTFSDQNRSVSDIFPGDNPAYGTGNEPMQNEAVAVIGRTEHLASTSLQEREFDNPIYSSGIVTEDPVPESNEDQYTVPDSVEDHYAIPNSSPSNVYDRVGDDSRDGAADSMYYSVITT